MIVLAIALGAIAYLLGIQLLIYVHDNWHTINRKRIDNDHRR